MSEPIDIDELPTWSFNGARFDLVYTSRKSNAEDTPGWELELNATDRPLIGTNRFERSIRGGKWVMTADVLIVPSDTAKTAYQLLADAFQQGIVTSLTDGVLAWNAVILAFGVVPLHRGTLGYYGPVTWGRPGG